MRHGFSFQSVGSRYPTSIPRSLERCSFFVSLNNVFDVSAPTIQRFLTLGQKVVPLIDGSDSRNCAGLMVEDFIRDMWRHSQPGHA